MKTNNGKALVVGAGISGIKTAFDLAETGCRVTLIDRSLHTGGILSQLDYQFPTNHCGMCRMLPLVQRDASSQFCLRKGLFHDNIDLKLGCELTSVSGEPGNFMVTIRQAPTWVDPDLCVGCGICSQACPVDVADDFNAGLATRKAIYLPVPHAVPNSFTIDPAACSRCGQCVEICPTNAIDLKDTRRETFNILVVDDELAMRDSLKEWLADEGFSVDMASSGSQALEMLQKKSYGLMLTDIKMPGMDGVELLQKAKEVLPELTVVMMTAYATVETAVEAMKLGAIDYLMKPFDPARMIPMVVKIFEDQVASQDLEIQVGAIVLACGTDYFDPSQNRDSLGYTEIPHVITSLEFERILSSSGPTGGKLLRPADGKPIAKIAWLQCVGSREIQTGADFCSSVCCMYALKEALLAKQKGGTKLETVIFYMDLRAFGLPFHRYLEDARRQPRMRLERARVHSVIPDSATGDPILTYMARDGHLVHENFDLVVLSVGQRPARRTELLARITGCSLNQWGFLQNAPLCQVATDSPGIIASGSATGLRDISESVIFASAAAAEAGQVIHSKGGNLTTVHDPPGGSRDVSRQIPRIMVAVCTCGQRLSPTDCNTVKKELKYDPAVAELFFVDHLCTTQGWQEIEKPSENPKFNRILIGACHPYLFAKKIKSLAQSNGLAPYLMEAVDLGLLRAVAESQDLAAGVIASLKYGIARLKTTAVRPLLKVEVKPAALVIGGGIAGMQAALTIAERGFPVTLVEKKHRLGGNLSWLQTTIDGHDIQAWLDDTVSRVEKHTNIKTLKNSRIIGGYGQVGNFLTTIETENSKTETLEHGVVILATGGRQAETNSYGHGKDQRIITQRRLEQSLGDKSIDPADLNTVVMIQCVDSRQPSRNYCSRVCCPTTIKHCLKLKAANPEIDIYVLYRDMMTPGFSESFFTASRKTGVIFIPYQPENKPSIRAADAIEVSCNDPVSGLDLKIEADLLVLATGIVPNIRKELAKAFGFGLDEDGFFKPADTKWRPVDALKEGVFACGICIGPRSSVEAAATGKAAAARALRILTRPGLESGRPVARVRASLCSACERCIEACPYGARILDPDRTQALVNPAMCQGCGTCAAVCPNGASVLDGYQRQQVFESLDALLDDI